MPIPRPAIPMLRLSALLWTVAALTTGLPAAAADSADAPTAAPLPAKSILEGFQLQEADEPLTTLVPNEGRTTAAQNRVDASAWFMAGLVLEKQNKLTEALDAYRRALAVDPDAVPVYRAYIPLAFTLNHTEEAVKAALKAVELDPDDYALLRRLGVHMAANSKLPEAIQLFEKASQAAGVDKHSEPYVILMRDLALLYRGTGQTEKAADAYEVVFDALQNPKTYELGYQTRKALRKDQSSSYERIGQTFLDAKRPELAVKAFELAVKEGQGLPGTLGYNLAQVHLQTGHADKALGELQKYLDAQLKSKGRDAYELLGKILKATGKESELLPRLEKLAERDARNSTLQYYLASRYMEAGRLDDAEALYKKTLEGSGDAQGYAGLAAVYRRQHRPSELLAALSKAIVRGENLELLETELKAISEDPKMVESLLEVGRKATEGDSPSLDFAGSLILAKLATATKKTAPAVRFYRFAMKQRPDRASDLYQELGSYLFEQDDYAEAEKLYRDAVDDPAVAGQKANWLFRLSQAAEMNGDTDAALDAIRDAQKLIPDHPLLHYQEGWVLYHAGRYDDAIRRFEQVARDFPEENEILRRVQFTLSALYVQKGEQRKGEEILERIYEQNPDDPSVNNDLGYLYADSGKNLEQAEKMIRKAVAAEPKNAAYIDSLGWVLFKRGKYEEALPQLQKATTMETGGDTTIWDHLGDVYDRLGKSEKAAEAWHKALEKGRTAARPDDKLIHRIEEKLKKVESGAGQLRPTGDDTP